MQGRPLTERERNDIRRLRLNGKGGHEIARTLSIGKTAVYEVLKSLELSEFEEVRRCFCGKEFIANNPKRIFCSHSHGMKHYHIYGSHDLLKLTRFTCPGSEAEAPHDIAIMVSGNNATLRVVCELHERECTRSGFAEIPISPEELSKMQLPQRTY